MSRPRHKPIAPQLQALMQLSGHVDLDAFAEAHGLSSNTVRTWDKRGKVPLARVEDFAKQYKIRAGDLLEGLVQADAPNTDEPHAAALMDARAGTGDFLLNAHAHLAAESTPPWAASSRSEPAGAQAGGVQAPNRRSVTTSALLRPRGAGAVRPLLLSLPLGEQGGPSRDYELIPKHTRTASAGAGGISAVADQLDLVGDMAFSFEWLRDNLGHTTGLLTTIKVRGDSMSTTLLDGDTIMIDEGTNMIDVDGIYVLDLYGRRLVKRVQHLFDGTLVLISDNPSYQRETIPRDKAREVRVIGRMVWPRV